MLELNADSAGGLLHHKTAPGTEIQRAEFRIGVSPAARVVKLFLTSTKPVSSCQSQPANPIPATSKIARLSLDLMTPAE